MIPELVSVLAIGHSFDKRRVADHIVRAGIVQLAIEVTGEFIPGDNCVVHDEGI